MSAVIGIVLVVLFGFTVAKWLKKRRLMAAAPRHQGWLTEVTAKVNPHAMVKNDDWPTKVLVQLTYTANGTPVTRNVGWVDSGQLPAAVRRRTVGSLEVLGNPRFAIADPVERDRALHAAKNGGHTFHLDPPMDVTVYEDSNGGVVWKLA